MRISFDVDDTLVCYQPGVACEPCRVPWYLKPWYKEPLRKGALALMTQLIKDGWDVGIYTTSYRETYYLKRFLKVYGIHLSFAINQRMHEEIAQAEGRSGFPSKFPRLFGIALHVDDSEGVALEGKAHNFSVVVVRPEDEQWAEKVLQAADQIRKSRC